MPDSVLSYSLGKPARFNRLPILAFAALAPAIFAWATNNIWEDFFITFRCSLNLAQGHGLSFEPGRVLHVFTSPLGTLLPATISWLLQSADAQNVLNVFRVVACLTLAAAWWRASSGIQPGVALAMTSGLWLLDPKLAAFSTNGMETALLVLGVVSAWRALVDGHLRQAGIALGFALWTRPDGFVYVGALMVAMVVLDPFQRRNWRGGLRVIALGAVIYLPWLVWASWYYGSPVPQTILAKSGVVRETGYFSALVSYPWRFFFGRAATDNAFLPPYFFFGGWPRGLWLWGKLIALAAFGASIWPRCARPARVAGLAFFLGGFYLEITPGAPWYFPAWSVLAYIATGGTVAALAESIGPAFRFRRILLGGFIATLLLGQVLLFAAVSVELHEQQRLIEWGVRAPLGRDLRRWAHRPADTVFLEPLGYIGYFSGLAMRDTPGLCSPEVVALRRAGHKGMGDLALALAPDWVVLRVSEYAVMPEAVRIDFGRHYQLVKQYDVRAQIDAVDFLPGRDFLEFDANYLLWQRWPENLRTSGQ